MKSCCDLYEELAHGVKWSEANTQFIKEEDDEDRSRSPFSVTEGGWKCKMCDGIFPDSSFGFAKKGTANQNTK